MKRKKKSYQRPKKPFEKPRMDEENVYKERYGLKNKREIWKTLAKINYFRGRAKTLAKSTLEEQEVLINKLKALGLPTNSIIDILGLKVEDLLKRRLPTVVANKKLANTVKEARQMVTHKRILVDGKVVSPESRSSLLFFRNSGISRFFRKVSIFWRSALVSSDIFVSLGYSSFRHAAFEMVQETPLILVSPG